MLKMGFCRRVSPVIVGTVLLLSCLVWAAGEDSAGAPLVNMMFFETNLREALNEISLQTGVTIIPDQTVGGIITADLQDVPLEKALHMILLSGGYTCRKIDDFYFVGLPDPRNSAFGQLVETEVVRLRHSTNRQIMEQLPEFMRSYVKGAQEGNILTISAPPSELQRIETLLKQLDQPQRMVEVKVVVTEVSSEAVRELGNTLLQYQASQGQTANEDWVGSVIFDGSLLTIGTDVYGDLLTKLRLLESEQKARIEANPRVLVADGETGEVFIGERQFVVVNGDGEDMAARVEEVQVGVSLQVSPRVVGEKEVLLQLSPQISHFIDDARPHLIVRESSVSTTIRLISGQTAVLAGMTMQEESDYRKKVPILGSIPLIRWLFRSDVDKQTEKELLVFITPVIK